MSYGGSRENERGKEWNLTLSKHMAQSSWMGSKKRVKPPWKTVVLRMS